MNPEFVLGDMCGWDECAPTIIPCTVGGVALPDHGELWTRPWTVNTDFSLSVVCPSWGQVFTRAISVTGHTVRLDYRVDTGMMRAPLLWAAHPQFRAFQGTRVQLTPRVKSVWDVTVDPAVRQDFSDQISSLDSLSAGQVRKFYLDPTDRPTAVELIHADGARMSMRWSDNVPYLGVWFDRGHFAQEDVIAIEPGTGFYDSAATAIERNRISTVEPFQTMTWSVIVSIT